MTLETPPTALPQSRNSALPSPPSAFATSSVPASVALSAPASDHNAALPQARLSQQSVLVIAQSISHLPSVSDSAATALTPDVEYRLRQIVQDALKFMRHSKRRRLLPSDINEALRLRNVDPVYGFVPLPHPSPSSPLFPSNSSNPLPPSHPSPHSAHPNLTKSPSSPSPLAANRPHLLAASPQPNNADPRPTTSPSARDLDNPKSPSRPSSAVEPSHMPSAFSQVNGIPHLFFAHSYEHNIQTLINTPLPPVPLEIVVIPHWLAIDSKQPKIPQNPVEPSDLDHDLANNYSALPHSKYSKHASSDISVSDTQIKPVLKHVLTRELQLYFKHLRNAIFKYDPNPIHATLTSVAAEHGIVQLLPYLSHFVANTVKANIHDLPLLFSLMRLVRAMNENLAFKLEFYLQQLLPSILTCLVGRRLCENPHQNHWALRDYTASLLRAICDRYEEPYAKLKQRLTITLGDALDNSKRPLTTHYGAIVGFSALGPLVVEAVLVPRLSSYLKKVTRVLGSSKPSPTRRREAAKVYGALAFAVSSLRNQHDGWQGNGHAMDTSSLESHRTISPEDVLHVLPNAGELIPRLMTEYGEDLFPLGADATKTEVANQILSLANEDASNG